MKVLVKEQVAESGVELLRAHFDVDLGVDWDDGELRERIGAYHGILIRSATTLTAELIEAATNLRAIGRAGIGVDNVDVEAATKRGIVVVNAPESNIVTAAEHTMALLMALARNVPQAHAALVGGTWARSKYSGVEVYEKTLGILGFGRIGQLVAARASGFGMHVVAFDTFVSPERFRELGVERAESAEELYAQSDFITVHLPKTPETEGFLDDAAFAAMRDGVRIVNCARGPLVDDAALQRALDAGKVAGAALDVFRNEPITEHPLFGYDNVVVTPHLGASTTEAQDRAGRQAAEQLVAALTGGEVTTAVNIPAIPGEEREAVAPYLPLCRALGRLAIALVEPAPVERIEMSFHGSLADRDTRLLGLAVLLGALSGHTEEPVNEVNAPSIARERGIDVSEAKVQAAGEDFRSLVRVAVTAGGERAEVAGTGRGPRHVPFLVEAWGQRFDVELCRPLALFRYSDVPGMVGRVGTAFGEAGINIDQMAVGRQPEGAADLAAMAVTTDAPVPAGLVRAIAAGDGFVDGRSVAP